MARPRALLVAVIAAGLVGSTSFEIATKRDDWPFSSYPMYSNVDLRTTVDRLLVFGLPASRTHEIPLVDRDQLAPFDRTRLGEALARMARQRQAQLLLRAAVRDVLARYERRRRAGAHRGPELRAARLYAVRWILLPDASNLTRPVRRRLLVEVRGPSR